MEQLPYLNKIELYGSKALLKGQIKKVKVLLRSILSDHQLILDSIEINLISDEELLKINKDSLDHDYYTDIITFDYSEKGIVTGDIYISVDRVKENANVFQTSLFNELLRVMCHGVLHLSGYKDKSKKDQTVMRKMENKYLSAYS